MSVTLLDILAGAGQVLLAFGLAFALVCLLISHLRFQALTRRAHEVAAVGNTAGDAFQVHIAHRLGTVHRDPAPFSVVLVAPERWTLLAEQYGRDAAVELVTLLEKRLRGALRRDDRVVRLREDAVGLLIGASQKAADAIGQRLVAASGRESFRLASGLILRVNAVAGAAAYPEHGDRAGELLAKAETALQHARVAGQSPQWPADTVAPELPAKAAHVGVTDDEQRPLVDELTGVLQEQRMGTALQKYVARCRRDERPVSILCVDVDYLRRYNDQYGRKTGDQLLRNVADFLQRNTREADLIARWEGDQFVIALQASPAEAQAIGQRLWNGVRRTPFAGAGPGLRLTVTIGVSGYPDHGNNARHLFESAQIALRVAKSKGRNQCLLFQENMRQLRVAQQVADAF